MYFLTQVQRHQCCNDYIGFFSLPLDQDKHNCPFPDSHLAKVARTAEWDQILSKVAVLMKKVELLEGLGRRKQCLRGCVGLEEVKCCDI